MRASKEVADLVPGDVLTFPGEAHRYRVVTVRPDGDAIEILMRDELEREVLDGWSPDTEVTVGYTNRRAKRQRIKAARRQRLRGEAA